LMRLPCNLAAQYYAGTSDANLGSKDVHETKERAPLAAESHPSLSHSFLINAGRAYEDRPPPPLENRLPPVAGARHSLASQHGCDGLRDDMQALTMGEVAAATTSTSMSATQRRTYGGFLSGKTFVRNGAEKVDDLSEEDKAAILADLQMEKVRKMQAVAERGKFHKTRRQREEASKAERLRAHSSEAEAREESRRQKQVGELKRWLQQKEEASKVRKARDSEAMKYVLNKDSQKFESLRKGEQERLEERERRLKISDKRKAKLEQQMRNSGELPGKKQGKQGFDTEVSWKSTSVASSGPAPGIRRMYHDGGKVMPMEEVLAVPPPQRVIHRHIHHHVHYHEGGQIDGPDESGLKEGLPMVSERERRRIEYESEARAKAELAAQARSFGTGGGFGQSASAAHIGHAVDHGAETPQMRRSASMGQIPPGGFPGGGFHMARTQQAFKGNVLPQLSSGGRGGVVAYQKNVERAIGSYADPGKPIYS